MQSKRLQDGGENLGNLRQLSDHQLKEYNINAHEFKAEYVDDISLYNISVNTKTGQLFLTPVVRGSRETIATFEFIKRY